MARALLFSSSAVRQGIPVVSARSVRVFFFGFGQMTGPPARARPPRRALRARVGDKHRPPCSFAVREHTQIESRLMEPPPHAHRTPRDGKKQQRRKKNQGEAPTRAHLPGGRDCAASSHAVPTANRTSPARPHAQRAREGAGGGAHKRAARRRGPSGQIARSRLPSDPGRRDALSPNEPANRRGRRLARWETARHFRAAGGQRDEQGGIKRARCPSAAAPEASPPPTGAAR